MTKETHTATATNTTETVATAEETPVKNRVTLVFKRPHILTEFNNYFLKKYGSIQEHRINVIEEMLLNFNETKKIEKQKPYYVEENRKLQEEKERLLLENSNYKNEVATLRTLTGKLKNYDSLKEDNIRLAEEVETLKHNIDELTKKLEKEEKNSIQVKELTDKVATETNNRVCELREILQSKEDEITSLNSKLNDYITVKEESVRLQETIKTKTLIIDDYDNKLCELRETLNLLEATQEEHTETYNRNYEELTEKLQDNTQKYNTLKEDNIRLVEEVNTKTHTIDELTKKLVKLEEETDKVKQDYKRELTENTNTYENRINNLITNHDETIKELIREHDNKISNKDKEIKKLNGLVSGYALNFSNYKVRVENMGLLDRIRKKFPEMEKSIKELNP